MKKWECISTNERSGSFTVGKIYESNNEGYNITADTGYVFKRTSAVKGDFDTEFIEIKEEDEKVREFKLGDRVRLFRDDWKNGLKGEVGTIVNIKRESSEGMVGIEFDNFTEGHNCNGSTKTKRNSVWYYKSANIELISSNDNKSEKSIHITTNGTSTHAVLKDGKEVIKRAKVGLFHEDEYKFETGVMEVVKKLLDVEISKDLSTFTDSELLDEIKRRMEK